MRAALIQLNVGDDPAANLPVTLDFVRQVAAGGATLLLTPEATNILTPDRDRQRALLVPESERASHSKWSDPNHPMFNGGLIGLISGGKIDAGKHRAERRERKLDRKEARFERKEARSERRHGGGGPRLGAFQSSPGLSLGRGGIGAPDSSRPEEGQDPDYFNRRITRRASPRERKAARSGGVIGAVKKVMQEDVLYLMIVPMPSEAEMAEARDMLAREKERN